MWVLGIEVKSSNLVESERLYLMSHPSNPRTSGVWCYCFVVLKTELRASYIQSKRSTTEPYSKIHILYIPLSLHQKIHKDCNNKPNSIKSWTGQEKGGGKEKFLYMGKVEDIENEMIIMWTSLIFFMCVSGGYHQHHRSQPYRLPEQ